MAGNLMADFQMQIGDAAPACESTVRMAGGHPIIRHERGRAAGAGSSQSTMVQAPAPTPAPVRVATSEPVGEACQVYVDPVERLGFMLEAATRGIDSGRLVLFGGGCFDQNGKLRSAKVAYQTTRRSKLARARRAAPKRQDGFTIRGGLEILAGFLKTEQSSDEAG